MRRPMVTCSRYRTLLAVSKLNGAPKIRCSLRSCGVNATTLSLPGPRRCYASGAGSKVTEVEKILQDTIQVCISPSWRHCCMGVTCKMDGNYGGGEEQRSRIETGRTLNPSVISLVRFTNAHNVGLVRASGAISVSGIACSSRSPSCIFTSKNTRAHICLVLFCVFTSR